VKPRRPNGRPTADVSDLPSSWAVENDGRLCDRCPADADHVVHMGRELGLCDECYRRVTIGR